MTAVNGLFRDSGRFLQAFALLVWVVQPFTVGTLIADALAGTETRFSDVVSAGAWIWWFLVLVALTVTRPITLTISRVGAPAAFLGAAWAAVEVEDSTTIVIGLIAGAVAAIAVLLPGLGDRFVDGMSYGDERRFTLRPPGPIVVAALVPTWVITVAGLAAGPLLLADGKWVAGAIVLAFGWFVAILGFRAMHRLAARFVVFVPNGFVVHDSSALREPVLFTSREIVGFAPARTGTNAKDFTVQALGLALELRLREPVKLPVVVDRTTTAEELVEAFLISPSRPAEVMTVAKERGLQIV